MQHILAKKHSAVIRGYSEALAKAKEHKVAPDDLLERLQPFARFRNLLVHQYWRIEDQRFLENIRDGLEDFHATA